MAPISPHQQVIKHSIGISGGLFIHCIDFDIIHITFPFLILSDDAQNL
jgi:hypothetical protein